MIGKSAILADCPLTRFQQDVRFGGGKTNCVPHTGLFHIMHLFRSSVPAFPDPPPALSVTSQVPLQVDRPNRAAATEKRPGMNDPSFSSIETPRLKLRRFHAEDKDAFLAYRNDPEVARYQSWETFTDEQATELIRDMETLPFGLPGQGLQIAIEHAESGSLAGDCYLQVDEHETRQAEIGFTFSHRFQGRGLANDDLPD